MREIIFGKIKEIDVASSEYKILLDMKKTITKFQPMISIEVGDVEVKGILTSKRSNKFFL